MGASQRAAGADAGRPARVERAQCGAGGHVVLRAVEQARRPAERDDGRGLSHRAHPRRRAAAEVEQVLPGDEVTAAFDRDLRELIEQPPQAPLPARGSPPWTGRLGTADRPPGAASRARAMQQVGLLEVGQRVQLEAAAREVLVQKLAAAERDLVAGSRERLGAPVGGVAPQLEEQGRHARCGEPARERDSLYRADHVPQLAPARAAQAAKHRSRPGERAPVAGHGGGGGRARALRLTQGQRHRAAPARRDPRSDRRPSGRSEAEIDLRPRRHERVLDKPGAVAVDRGHGFGERGRGPRRHGHAERSGDQEATAVEHQIPCGNVARTARHGSRCKISAIEARPVRVRLARATGRSQRIALGGPL